MDKQHDVYEQLTLSNFKMWSPTVLKIFNNYRMKMANNSNSDNMSIS